MYNFPEKRLITKSCKKCIHFTEICPEAELVQSFKLHMHAITCNRYKEK